MVTEKNTRREMTNGEKEAVKEQLLNRKRALWQEVVADLEQDAGAEHQDLIQTVKDEGDDALEELRESTVFSLIEMKVQELETIERALGAIESGRYGQCMDCGKWIKPARLEIMPHAVRCLKCQSRWERREKGSY